MKTTWTIIALLVYSMFAYAGCSSSGSKGQGAGDGSRLIDEDIAVDQNSRFGDGNIPGASERNSGLFQDIHFGYDSSTVEQDYHEMLRLSAGELNKDPSIKVEIEGHCDKRGTKEYNLALGEERVKAVQRMLINFGAGPNQITTISYGEEIPLDPEDSEEAFAKNRRVHFALFREKTGQDTRRY